MATVFGSGLITPRPAQAGSSGAARRKSFRPKESPASQALLSTLIEGEIIPQLLAAHRGLADGDVEPGSARIDADEVRRFAPLPLVLEADELFAHVEELLDRGVSAESIFVDLLAPSARKLGEFWEADSCDFLDVTIGLWRLQEVMREVAWRVPSIAGPLFAARTALFSPMPGEQHSFGCLMVEEVFSRAGWQTETLIEPHKRDLFNAVGARPLDVIGLTLSNDCHSGALTDLISAIRTTSMNPRILVLVGGRAINADPALADLCGADGTAPDGASALALAERLVERHAQQRVPAS